MSYDPYSGYTAASHIPDYYNPYRMGSAAGASMQQAQQAAQPRSGKDTPTPGSKHGKGRRVRIAHPTTGEVREVDERMAQHYITKGGRLV